ncbi:MAG: ABC transporter ATP-binding protein [Armatimonadota bacterium]|nr:ABC transporter ATP-binding protein [Armatimonadota bacterium]MDR7426739.1 ABC transporter ATP-binding protein [Armatimonadota bacterium]MDR7464413.1 ABC transporter ATP-binding protein [Armatimonadota bacterium]MDR7471055.1 ABC transporter ATP-binding protein [Armatimonadota bacterium]MDR7475090.1 ABC transporter ATP-binding protein [Armatimonadota bacterium]
MISPRLRGAIVRHRGEYARGFALGVVATGVALLAPAVLRRAVDGIRAGISLPELLGLAAAYVGLALLAAAIRFFWRTSIIGASRRIEYELRNAYFAHLQRLHLGFFQHTRTGDLMARAINDLHAVQRLAGPGIMYAANTPVMLLLVGGWMVRLDLHLALWVGAIMPLIAVTFFLLGRQIHHRFQQVQEQFSTLSARAQENFSGIRVVKAFAQEPYEIADFARLAREFIRRNLRLMVVQGALWPSMTLILGVAAAVLLWQGGLAVVQGRITVGTLVQFYAYLGQLAWPMIALGWVTNLIQQGVASMGRLDEILNVRPAIADHPDPHPLRTIRGEIEFRDVSFAYDGKPVLHGITLRIPAGSTVAVVGPTGSGKSTLVSLIARLFDPTEGRVLIDGVDSRRLPLALLRRAIGFVPQEPFLFSETIEENLGFGLESADGRRILAAAEVAQLAEEVAEFPQGYSTVVGERGVTLSGGQKQRATLARALARDPAILILDDALSSVDTHTEARILERLRGVLATRTSILISHRISTVRHADQIIVLDEGRIVERGAHEALLARGGLYADLYRKQLLQEELEAEQ